jgi:nicotinate-nucleotide adenylyltransferase
MAMKIGLYFGSFNPIHTGHLIIANQVINYTSINQVWFVVSPHNPLKSSTTLLNEYHRLHLVQLAIGDNIHLKASDIEFKLPRPSYTIDTLIYLREKYPTHEFSIIMGSDSWRNISKWKNAEVLKKNYHFLIYPRPGFPVETEMKNVEILKTPLLEISATTIRKMTKEGKSIRYLVPEKVQEEIEKSRYYL